MPRNHREQWKILGIWSFFIEAMGERAEDFPLLREPLGQLEALLEEARALKAEQAEAAARRAVASRRLAEVLEEGQKLQTFLSFGLKHRYGNRSSKLIRFGLRPHEKRGRAAEPATADSTAAPSPIPPAEPTP